jgi:hypothetical protein
MTVQVLEKAADRQHGSRLHGAPRGGSRQMVVLARALHLLVSIAVGVFAIIANVIAFLGGHVLFFHFHGASVVRGLIWLVVANPILYWVANMVLVPLFALMTLPTTRRLAKRALAEDARHQAESDDVVIVIKYTTILSTGLDFGYWAGPGYKASRRSAPKDWFFGSPSDAFFLSSRSNAEARLIEKFGGVAAAGERGITIAQMTKEQLMTESIAW